jgi:hypothetical protein
LAKLDDLAQRGFSFGDKGHRINYMDKVVKEVF